MRVPRHKHPMKKLTIQEMTLIAMFTVLAIVGGKISIQLAIVPITFQVVVALLTGVVLGARLALISQLLYLIMGLVGLPVFARGGGLAYVFQMSFGYLIGFVAAAAIVGLLVGKLDRHPDSMQFFRIIPIMLLGLLIIYSFGVAHMMVLKNLYTKEGMALVTALQAGVLPFLVTDGLWCLLAAAVAPRLRRISAPYLRTVSSKRPAAEK